MGKKIKHSKKIAVIVSNFNNEITDGLLKGALKVFEDKGIKDSSINVIRCPGAFEIPYIANKLCVSKKYSVVICLGAVIKGETAHFEYISDAVSKSIAGLNLHSGIPVIFGVLTCYK
ncbi:MAG: 6,7-dimethyl-8-ribityllumazine synthase, partial [Ignavibacteria bacterium]